MYKIDIITLFPNLIEPYLQDSIMKIAIQEKAVKVTCWDLREFSTDKHKNVDDTPYGGGAGMILSPQPMYDCITHIKKQNDGPVIFLTPSGDVLTQETVENISTNQSQSLILICGRYEGLDQRVIDLCVDIELSVGEYVLSGGELPALILTEAITRLLPGVLGNQESHKNDSFSEKFKRKKKYPVYTKPETFMGKTVPSVLLSGHHKNIEQWKLDNLR